MWGRPVPWVPGAPQEKRKGHDKLYDFIIKNVRIIDGTGMPGFYGEVAVKDRIITKVRLESLRGYLACHQWARYGIGSGFIDSHSHSDTSWFVDRRVSQVDAGVTTEVTGQCGASAAPFTEKRKSALKNRLQKKVLK